MLRDHFGKVLCLFSSYVGIQDIAAAEILAIAKACELLGSRTDLIRRCITIVSDSQIAVDWVKNRGVGGEGHANTVQFICSCLDSYGFTSVIHGNRNSNQFADSLARKGAAGREEVRWAV